MLTNFTKRDALTDTQRRFLHKYWLDMLDDVEEGLMRIEDADKAYQIQLDYLFKEETNNDSTT